MIYTHLLNLDWQVFAVQWTVFEAIEGGYYADPHKLP